VHTARRAPHNGRRNLFTALALLTTIAALALPAAASADTSTVSMLGCYFAGGNVTRPAGNDILLRLGWAAKTQGMTIAFLNSQTTTVSTNGGTPVDISGLYSDPAGSTPDGWSTIAFYPTGIVLAPGESVTFHWVATVTHRLVDGATFDTGVFGRPFFFGPGVVADLTCTVTGV